MTGRSKRIWSFVIAAGLIFCPNGWIGAGRAVASGSAPLAIVGGKPITAEDFKKEMARRQIGPDQKRKEELLDSMVRSELLFASARSAGYENDPEVLAAVRQIMAGKYVRDNLAPKLAGLKATDQEAEAYYREHLQEFSAPATVHAALIRIAIPPKASAEKKAELLKRGESARAEAMALEAGVPAFGSVALKYSEEQSSRYRGGDIGWLQTGTPDGRWDRKVTDAIFALKRPGQVSPVVPVADGYYIVKLIEAKGVTVKPFADVKDGVRYQVIQEKRKKIEQEFFDQLKEKIPVTLNSGLLQTMEPSGEGKKAGPPALPAR
jgi:parvulin-like peptidyl-prolyl isomerase